MTTKRTVHKTAPDGQGPPSSRSRPLALTRREMLAFSSALLMTAAAGEPVGPKVVRTPLPKVEKEPRVSEERPNIVVVLSDCLRADHLTCYGYDFPTSPAIDQLAREGFLFERCYSQAPWTKPSIASLYTGVLPPVHQAVVTEWGLHRKDAVNVQIVRDGFDTLAARLQRAGYNTGLFLTNAHVQAQFGFGKGFKHYRFINGEDAAHQMTAVLRWLERASDAPFFAFVHIIDPHGPYKPPEGTLQRLFNKDYREVRAELPDRDAALLDGFVFEYDKGSPRHYAEQLSEEGTRYLRTLYDAEIAYVDFQFYRLMTYLRRSKLLDNTVIVLTGDHGEAFNEHGFYCHGNALYDEEVHVPLIIRLPERQDAQRVPCSVAQFDLYSTLLTLAGLETPSYAQSRSLFTADGTLAVTDHRPVFSYHDGNRPDTESWDGSMVYGDLKIRSVDHNARLAVTDLSTDPREMHWASMDVGPNDPAILGLRTAFRQAQKDHAALRDQFGEPEWSQMTEQDRDHLKALGYL